MIIWIHIWTLPSTFLTSSCGFCFRTGSTNGTYTMKYRRRWKTPRILGSSLRPRLGKCGRPRLLRRFRKEELEALSPCGEEAGRKSIHWLGFY